MTGDDAIGLLAGFSLFSSLPQETTIELAERLRRVDVRCGEALVRQGEPGASLFLVVDGRFEARQEVAGGATRVLGVIGRGETIGEMAVISSAPRICTVIATRRSRVLELSGADFLRVLERHPAQLLALTQQIVRRSQQQTASSPVRRIALLPLSRDVDVPWLGEHLADALSRFGTAIRLGRALALAQAGRSVDGTVPPLSTRFLEWLDDHERSNSFVVYEAMHQMGEWTHRCLAQADLVLLVGDADAPPDLTALERAVLGADGPVTLAPRHLVLLRRKRGTRPSGTAPWLDVRDVAMHHHVALDAQADVARLARILAGRAVQLVLSGGGVRGFAHIGVLRAFEEAGLPVDFVGGASIGALIGGLAAMEWSAARMHDALRRVVLGRPRVVDFTFPFVSFFAARRGTKAIREMCDGYAIEDLPLGYFAVSADLCRAEEIVHRRGPLWFAMRTSGSLPGAFPPVVTEDQCLVDGGILNNLPTDVMARVAPGRVVAVDVSQEIVLDLGGASMLRTADTCVSGWRLLLRRLNPFAPRGPRMLHVGDVLARSSEIASVRIGRSIQEKAPVALRIEPPVGGYRMLDFDSFDPIVEAGYAHASANIAAYERLLSPDGERPARALREPELHVSP